MQNSKLVAAGSAILVSSTLAMINSVMAGEQIGMLPVVLLAHAVLAAGYMIFSALTEQPEAEPLDEEARVDGVARRYGLSRREQEVLASFVRSRDIRTSANELFISPGTVKAHLSHMYSKTGARGCTELLRLCDDYPNRMPAVQAA